MVKLYLSLFFMISVIPLVFLCHRKYVNRKRRTLCYMQHSTLTQNFLHGSVNIALVRTAIRKLQSLSAPFNPVYNFSSLLSRITSRILPNYHYTKQRPPLFYNYIEKNCIQSIQCCISRRSKTAKIKCYKL